MQQLLYVLYFFQSEPGENQQSPNACIIPGYNAGDQISLSTFLKYFPLPQDGLHFRFRIDDPLFGYLWKDISEVDTVLPKSGEKEKLIFAKILKLPTDDRHIAQRRKYVLKKTQRHQQSSLAKTVESIDVDRSNQNTRHVSNTAKQATDERREPHYSDEVFEEPKSESYDSDGDDGGVGVGGDDGNGRSDGNIEITAEAAVAAAPDEVDMLNFDAPEFSHSSSSSSQKQFTHTVLSSVSADMNGIDGSVKLSREELIANREKETASKVQDALSFTRMLGEKAQQEAIELDEAKSKHETKLKAWAVNNKEKRNVRTLLSTMHTVLWADSKWKPIGLGDVIEAKQVKLQYRKAMLVVHPDRSSNADTETKFIAKRIFEAINEAYEEFLKKESPL